MGRKGRRQQSKKGKARGRQLAVAVARSLKPDMPGPMPAPSEASSKPPNAEVVPARAETTAALASAPPAGTDRPEDDPAPESTPALSCEVRASAAAASEPPQADDAVPEPSVPPVGDLDVEFFERSTGDFWLAELNLNDPRLMLKGTPAAARRRAHLTRYVIGVMSIACALGVAALIKSAVPVEDDDPYSRPAARMVMPRADGARSLERASAAQPPPAVEPLPAAQPADPAPLSVPAPASDPAGPAPGPEAHELRDAGPG